MLKNGNTSVSAARLANKIFWFRPNIYLCISPHDFAQRQC
nr:MAG TPA: hypothetical protein [Caudoviricetes sp.]DAT04533.1 MAG TPA: hypothetical protein [Bacteriophage sp.]